MAGTKGGQQDRDDMLNYLQIEALGIKRREKIVTTDFKENKDFTPVSQLEDMRKAHGKDYNPGKKEKSILQGWNTIHQTIGMDGTLQSGDLRDVNEGLGQTHRLKLLVDDSVRRYSGEPIHHTRTRHQKNVNQRTPGSTLAYKGRVVKNIHLPTPPRKSQSKVIPIIKPRSSKPKERRLELLLPKVPIQSPHLVDPKTWWASLMSSIQGVKKGAASAPEQPDSAAPHESGMETAAEPEPLQILQPTLNAPTKPPQQPAVDSTPNHPQQSTVDEQGSVSVAYLISLGVKFSPEQLRAIAALSKESNLTNEMSTPMDRPVTGAIPVEKQDLPDSVERVTVDDEDGVNAQEAESLPIRNDSQSAIHTLQNAPRLTTAKENNVTTPVNPFAGEAPSEEIAYPTSRSETLRRQREMIIGSQVYKNRYSHAAGTLVDNFQKMTLTDLSPPTSPTYQFNPTAYKSATHAPAPSSPAPSAASVVTSAVSRTAADPLVTKALAGNRESTTVPKALAGSRGTTGPKAPASTRESTTSSSPPPPPPPAAPLLRPRFIPDTPVTSSAVTPPAPLAARTVNPPLAVTNPFGPAKKSRRPAPPSLPPHLMGKLASSDPGAAARAQYGG